MTTPTVSLHNVVQITASKIAHKSFQTTELTFYRADGESFSVVAFSRNPLTVDEVPSDKPVVADESTESIAECIAALEQAP